VLSAAHCYLDPDVAAIRTDPYRLDDPLPDSSILRVKEIVLHPDRTNYDIMIIKMWDSVDLPLLHVNENPDQPVKGQILASAGWGTTQFGEDKPPEVLQYTDRLVYLTNEECINITLANPYENYNGSITDNELCALEAGTGSCQGDSGGPLIIPGSTAEEDLLVSCDATLIFVCVVCG
jgi:trypsin